MKPASNNNFPFVLPQRAINLAAICVVTAALAACGGGSGGGTIEGGSDVDTDGDGISDDEEVSIGLDPNDPNDALGDLDNDSISNLDEIAAGTDPNNNDTDGDFLRDNEELQIGTDPTLADTDGNGTNDGDEDFDGDEIVNFQEFVDGTDPLFPDTDTDTGDGTPTPMECADPDSSNADWSDNCQLQRFGDFADSLYTLGVQRILHCQGFDNGQTFEVFTDGEFGPATEGEVENFQEANNLVGDGVVGPQTWGALFETLSIIPGPDVIIGGQSFVPYSIDGCDATQVQFYQEVDFDILGGWQLAATPGSTELIGFSTGSPF